MTARNGKIARLPREIRDEVNRLLDAGQPGPEILHWLNAHPAVQAVLAGRFATRPITLDNLSEWRRGGFLEARREQQTHLLARDLLQEADSLTGEAGHQPLSDRLKTLTALTLARLLRAAMAEEPSLDRHQAVLSVARELSRLRNDDHREVASNSRQNRTQIGVDRTKSE